MISGSFLYGTYVFLSSFLSFSLSHHGSPRSIMKDLSSASVYCAQLARF